MKKIKLFLGGTCNDSTWRDDLLKMLDDEKVDAFNPVVKDWNEECQKREIEERENTDYCLYVITPRMSGVYSIAEVIDDSNKRPDKTLFCILEKDEDKTFEKHNIKSLDQVKKMVAKNGGKVFENLKSISDFLNNTNMKKSFNLGKMK